MNEKRAKNYVRNVFRAPKKLFSLKHTPHMHIALCKQQILTSHVHIESKIRHAEHMGRVGC